MAHTPDAPVDAGPARRVRIEPGFVLVVALLAGCGWSLHGLAVDHGDVTTSAWVYVAVFTTVLLLLIAVHELAHVGAARRFGHRLVSVRIGSKFGVTMLGEHTRKTTVVSAAAGPVVGTLAAVLVMAASSPWSALWAAAGVALVENIGNVALFFLPGSDGSKLVAAMRHPKADVIPLPAASPTAPEESAA